MKTLLLLAYYFPPVGGAGTQRALWLARHLPDLGWRVVVLTAARDGREQSRWAPMDETLVGPGRPGLDVRRVAPDPGTPSVLVPPQRRTAARWLGPATAAARRIVQQEDVDVVAATLSPFELADVALDVGERQGVPVLLDLRDPWALDGWIQYRSAVDWAVEALRMRRALSRADAVIANTEEAARVLTERGGADAAAMHHVPNGWSREDFAASAGAAAQPHGASDARLTIVHTGSFHTAALRSSGIRGLVHHRPEPIDPSGRTPVPLVAAVDRLVRHDPSYRERLRLVHVGAADDPTRAAIEAAPVDTTITGYLPHAESVGWLRRADVLFLPLHDLPPGRRSRIVPGKTYEYLAAGRPILAAVPPGEARDLAASVPGSEVVAPCDRAGLAAAVASLVARHESHGGLPQQRSPLTPDFERSVLAARFAAVLDRLVP